MYGWRGSRRTVSTGPSSTSLPAYSTPTREHIFEITPRLWLMNSTEVWSSRWSRDTRSSTSASTVASSPVVGSSRIEQGGVLRESHRDHDPLLHSPRELVRESGHHRAGVRDLDVRERLAGPLLGRAPRCAENREGLGDLRADADRRVQGGAGVLVDHRHGLRAVSAQRPAAEREHVPAGNGDRAAGHATVPGEVADDRERRCRLPASRLAHQPVRLAAADLEGDAAEHGTVDSAHGVHDVDVAKLECRRVRHRSSTC